VNQKKKKNREQQKMIGIWEFLSIRLLTWNKWVGPIGRLLGSRSSSGKSPKIDWKKMFYQWNQLCLNWICTVLIYNFRGFMAINQRKIEIRGRIRNIVILPELFYFNSIKFLNSTFLAIQNKWTKKCCEILI
jgi:hypothetical protein